MSDLSRTEQIYIQKCRLQDRQDSIYYKLMKLLEKSEIEDAMENVRIRKSQFNCFFYRRFSTFCSKAN